MSSAPQASATPMPAGARPGYHIAPGQGWLNDPNGLVRHDGRWHVFFQHNPTSPRHGDIAWGHVSSPDLVAWTEHPVAFGPEPGGPDEGGCWSGVCVVEPGRGVAAAYTGIRSGPADSVVCLRRADDDRLDSWSRPAVVGTPPSGIGLREMRDPYVFGWGERRWALLGAWLEDGPGLLLWSCDDLDSWRFERVWMRGSDSVLGTVALADLWECPQLVEVDGSWVLLVSLWRAGLLDRVIYAVGDLVTGDDGTPEMLARAAGPVDEGNAFYAPQVLAADQAAPGGPLLFGWVREPEILEPPTPGERVGIVGCLTLPRRLALDGDRLTSAVDPALDALPGAPVSAEPDELLPAACVLDVGADPVTLLGRAESVAVPPGSHVWLDGSVAEVYPPDGVPRTYRDLGVTQWRLGGQPSTVIRCAARVIAT